MLLFFLLYIMELRGKTCMCLGIESDWWSTSSSSSAKNKPKVRCHHGGLCCHPDMDSILKVISKRSGNSGFTPTVYHWSRDDVLPDKFVAGLKLGPFACCLLEQVSPQFCVLLC